LQYTLSLNQRGCARVESIEVQQIEGVVDQPVIASTLEVVLERTEVRAPIGVSRNHLTVNDELARR
jgi:hypothetical protein